MDRDTAVTLSVSALALVALGASAATLESAVTLGAGEGGGSVGSGAVDGPGSGTGPSPLLPGEITGEFVPVCFPMLREPLVVAAIGLAFVGLFTYIYRDNRDAFSAFVVCGVVAIPTGIVWALLAFCGAPLGSTPRTEDLGLSSPSEPANETRIPLFGGGSGEASGTAVSAPTLVVFVLVGIALLGALAIVLASRGDDDADVDVSEPQTSAGADVAAVARAAGTAADRIAADAPVDNEVFRAWGSMTDALELESPETTTPAAFEAAAVEVGMAPDDVEELRRLFEEVRYGGEAPSADRERRAVSALRRIEREYGELDASEGDR